MRYLFLFFILITSYVSAQVPQAINYQGVLRNASGQAVSMKTINVQVSITSDKVFSISNLLYSEKFTVITNEFGTYSISIGYGKPITGTFSGIDWSTGKQWIFVEVDEDLNNVYEFVGSMQFASVPYSLYANTAKIADSVRNAVGIQGPRGATGAAGTNGTNGATWFTGTLVPATTTGVLNDLYLNTTNGDYYKKTGANVWTLQANLTGSQGPQGLTGATGPQGPTGLTGAAGTSGANGTSGVNGATWYTGSGTASTTTGVINDLYLNIATGDYYKKTGSSIWTFLANISTGIPGPQGPQGIQGPAGATGATGPQGLTGAQGPQGLQGVAGATGATGPQGLTGATGAQGLIGATGPQGIQGFAGPTGATGAIGAAGTNGTNGTTWYTGSGTATSTTGVVNDLYLNTSTGDYYKKTGAITWTLQANLTGPQGSTGATGPQGVAGPTGAIGSSGTNGTNGTVWLTGTTSPTTSIGVVNDLYLNTTNGDYFKKTGASIWTLLSNLTGPQGAAGTNDLNKQTTNLSNIYSNSIVYFNSGTWTVPTGINSITVELWGGAGGGGGLGCSTYPPTPGYGPGGNGGNGGSGGYNKVNLNVTPSQVFNIIVGTGGSRGTLCGPDGGNGGNSSFSTYIADGGTGGKTGAAGAYYSYAPNGIDGIILNYNYPYQTINRTFIPNGYIKSFPQSFSQGGKGAILNQENNGTKGEDGLVIIFINN
jgi:hypothetical protein